jgi:4-amino-4-deoxy-L-arabinose transferase-like glycosyltransferase
VFWQAPLYQTFLVVFHQIVGESLLRIQLLHVAVGSLNCVLLYHLTRCLFGVRAARVAAAMASLYAPFWLFDVQPLPANFTVLMSLGLAIAFLQFLQSGGRAALLISAATLGGLIITHGLAISALPVVLYYLANPSSRVSGSVHLGRRWTAVFVLVAALPPAGVSLRNWVVSGQRVFVSYNSGANLYIGNNPDFEDTLALRGGFEWRQFFRPVFDGGSGKPEDMNRYFLEKTWRGVKHQPLEILSAEVKKTLVALGGTETKRNFPIYPLREHSRLLTAFLWKLDVGGRTLLAFPSGLILPLALLAFWLAARGRLTGALDRTHMLLPGSLAAFHLLAMILFFPTARYRVPAVMLLLPYAAALIIAWADALRGLQIPSPAWTARQRGLTAALGAALFLISNAVAPQLLSHPVRDRAEHLGFQARHLYSSFGGKPDPASELRILAMLEEATAIDPDYPEVIEILAYHYAVKTNYPRALELAEILFARFPYEPQVQKLVYGLRTEMGFAPEALR